MGFARQDAEAGKWMWILLVRMLRSKSDMWVLSVRMLRRESDDNYIDIQGMQRAGE